jgi:hypothetical protein
MYRGMRMLAAMTVLVSLGSASMQAAAAWHRTKKVKGQIIAFRAVDRVVQMASFVENREIFLFRLNGHDTKGAIVKLVYEHFGYSILTDEVLHKQPVLDVTVRRDKSCDETYGAFVRDAPTIQSVDGEDSGIAKIVFIGTAETLISPGQKLKCYRTNTVRLQ